MVLRQLKSCTTSRGRILFFSVLLVDSVQIANHCPKAFALPFLSQLSAEPFLFCRGKLLPIAVFQTGLQGPEEVEGDVRPESPHLPESRDGSEPLKFFHGQDPRFAQPTGTR